MRNDEMGTTYDHLFVDPFTVFIIVDFVLPGDYGACSIVAAESWSFGAILLPKFDPINVHSCHRQGAGVCGLGGPRPVPGLRPSAPSVSCCSVISAR